MRCPPRKLDELIAGQPDPDSWGLYDRADALYGLGLVACQEFLTSSYRRSGLKRAAAVAQEPMYSPTTSYAEVVDAAANFWKHHGEWPSGWEERTRAVLDRVYPSQNDYPMSNVLAVLLGKPTPLRLAGLVPLLEQWRRGLKAT